MSLSNNLDLISTEDYRDFIKQLKSAILSTSIKAALAINKEVLNLYWDIGKKSLRNRKLLNEVISYLTIYPMTYNMLFLKCMVFRKLI